MGQHIATSLVLGDIVYLEGSLGAGKTTLTKAIIASLTATPHDQINSPTFTYVNEYAPVYHFDLYRLPSKTHFSLRGFDEYCNDNSICLIEWPERGETPPPSKIIRIEGIGHHPRTISIEVKQ